MSCPVITCLCRTAQWHTSPSSRKNLKIAFWSYVELRSQFLYCFLAVITTNWFAKITTTGRTCGASNQLLDAVTSLQTLVGVVVGVVVGVGVTFTQPLASGRFCQPTSGTLMILAGQTTSTIIGFLLPRRARRLCLSSSIAAAKPAQRVGVTMAMRPNERRAMIWWC